MNAFKIGDKVVSIYDHSVAPLSAQDLLLSNNKVIGEIPRERVVYIVNFLKYFPEFGILGVGVIGSTVVDNQGVEIGWDSKDFRLLEEIKNSNQNKNHATTT